MKITVFGAAGEVGSRIVTEALSRGHEVTAVVRRTEQIQALPQGAKHSVCEVSNAVAVAQLSAGQDLIVSAVRPPSGDEDLLVEITQAILQGAAQSKVRVIVVGGAASLNMPDQVDTTVLTAPNFLPQSVIAIAKACYAQHQMCKADHESNWAYFSPPGMLVPGIRTGKFRLGLDELLVDQEGVSKISMEDFAVAMIDEAENAKHHRSRFTAAY